MATPRYLDATSPSIHSQRAEELLILSLKLGFNFAALGTIVNGCDDFAFGNVRVLDRLFRMPVHQRAAVWTTHSLPYSSEMFSRPCRRALAIQMSSSRNLSVRPM